MESTPGEDAESTVEMTTKDQDYINRIDKAAAGRRGIYRGLRLNPL